MHKLYVFNRRDMMKREFDFFWQEHSTQIETIISPYKLLMRNGEMIMFAVINGPNDYYKVQGMRFDDIELRGGIAQQTAEFLRSRLVEQDTPNLLVE